MAQVLAQMLCNFLGGLAVERFQRVGAALAVGGLFSFVTLLFVLFIVVPKEPQEKGEIVIEEERKSEAIN